MQHFVLHKILNRFLDESVNMTSFVLVLGVSLVLRCILSRIFV